MDTSKLSDRDKQVVEWILNGLAAGRLRVEPEYDGNEYIVAVQIKLKQEPVGAHRVDPRRTKPL